MGIGGMLKRHFARGIAAEAHERKIHGNAVKPGRKGRIAAESADFSKNEQESLLREIFGGSDISDDAETDRKNARAVAAVNAFESGSVAALRARDDNGFRKLRIGLVGTRSAVRRDRSGCELRLHCRSHFAPKCAAGTARR